ncbi:MAG: ImmA/IrrE family metallo-endopeptidase [Clostridia bacterium]|nr:ImmA/IrrE family metallo-endopeptidase [Clostridia bacterium]
MSRLKTSEKLIDLAGRRGIGVYEFPLPLTGCCEVCLDGACAVGIDPHVGTEAEKTVMLAHGLGHCLRGEFYNVYSPYDVRAKHERRADEWAIRKILPYGKIKKAVRRGETEPWQIAELFGVTVPFAEKALRYYFEK